MEIQQTKFRFDINALRAIAVTSVLFYHYKVGFLNGGFAGVDIFFVISGYLMTKIIFQTVQEDRFSYFVFLTRRAQRIVPALVFMVVLITLTELLTYFPWNLKASAASGLASLLFYSNIKYIRHAGYFDPASSLNIYLHTWSLSVEFQFYLLYPLLLIGLKKLSNEIMIVAGVLLALALLSFIFSVWFTKVHPDASFYLLPTRAWELIAGGLAYFSEGRLTALRTRSASAVLGYTLLAASLILFKQQISWPGIFTLIPVVGTFLIIIARLDYSLLKTPLIQFTGKISYSLYLWHWPVFVLGQYFGVMALPGKTFILIILATGLAVFSYHFIEKPKVNLKKLAFSVGISLILLAICNRLTINEFIFKKKTLEIADYMALHDKERSLQFSEGKCFITTGNFADYKRNLCLDISGSKKNLLLIGDSHAAEISQSLRDDLHGRNINLLQATASGCLPLISGTEPGYCTELNTYMYTDFIAHHAGKLGGIILSGDWSDAPDKNILLANMNKTIRYLKKFNLKIILIGQTESYMIPYSEIVAREYQYQLNLREAFVNRESVVVNDLLKQKFPDYYVDIYNRYNVPGMAGNQIPYIFDLNHLSKYGADLAVSRILADHISIKLLND